MSKINILIAAVLFISIIPLTTASLDHHTACIDADLVIPVDLWVTGVNCHDSNKTEDSAAINIPSSGSYTIKGIVERGRVNQKQKNEAFFLEILGQQGPTAEDDSDENAITSRLDFLGTFNLPQGSIDVIMKTSSICPPDTDANSVDLTYLCLFKEDNETSEDLFLNIISPRERTYDDRDILIELESNGNISFSFNNGKTNETYTSEIEKRLSEGKHTLTAFAFKGNESLTKSVDFKIDLDDDDNDNDRSSGTRLSTRLQPYQYNSTLEVSHPIVSEVVLNQAEQKSTLSPWLILLIILLIILVVLIAALSAR